MLSWIENRLQKTGNSNSWNKHKFWNSQETLTTLCQSGTRPILPTAPCTIFWWDWRPLVQMWINASEEIVIVMDDKCVTPQHYSILCLFWSEAVLHHDRPVTPPTQQCGSQPMDGLFVMPGHLDLSRCYLGKLDGITGDHHCLWLNLPEQWLFSSTMPPIVHARARHLKLECCSCTWCNAYLESLLEQLFA